MGRQKEDPLFNCIEAARQAKGLSRQQLADAVGVHYQTIGYLERGEYSPSLVLALRIAKVLNKKVEQIFTLEEGGEYSPSLTLALRLSEVLGQPVEALFSVRPF